MSSKQQVKSSQSWESPWRQGITRSTCNINGTNVFKDVKSSQNNTVHHPAYLSRLFFMYVNAERVQWNINYVQFKSDSMHSGGGYEACTVVKITTARFNRKETLQ